MSKKNSSVLNLKTLKQDKIFLSAYNVFKENLKSIKKKSFLVAVSGGPDSLALAALSYVYNKEMKNEVFYVHIDHKIRKNSSREADLIKKFLKKYNINLNLLSNKNKIDNNVQSKARIARYDLMKKFCEKKKVSFILTAHHSDDQIETFLIRLSRGSGVQGLSSMRIFTKLDNKRNIVRPFLSLRKKDLIYISKKTFGKFYVDPSNSNKKYLRTKIRSLKKVLEKSGITHNQILKSINNLISTTEIINLYIEKIRKKIIFKKRKVIIIKYKEFTKENSEIQLKLLSQSIKELSKSYYPPRSKKVFNILNELNSNKRKRLTLSKCSIERVGNFIKLKSEA